MEISFLMNIYNDRFMTAINASILFLNVQKCCKKKAWNVLDSLYNYFVYSVLFQIHREKSLSNHWKTFAAYFACNRFLFRFFFLIWVFLLIPQWNIFTRRFLSHVKKLLDSDVLTPFGLGWVMLKIKQGHVLFQ